ncbi:MAG: hypothetical protein A3F67_04875 [Verrucomicrobia bacterium RIFCSPHIGHO2_12_FULL_41_10]|nr:MAG: hypothetical protein A3F67_04875 [Verrucomicrobia bacterium RIFCSPHIGHO2_12_FULL_41_10]HLB33129.1 hypothetical protein [Chthoniobacterales bacterium]
MNIIKKVFLLIIFLGSTCFADILSSNTGEQAMINSLRSAINANAHLKSQKIVIGAGRSGCEAFKRVAQSKNTNVLLTWQWLEEIKDLPKETIVIMPECAVDGHENKNILITIDGVLHTRNLKNVQDENSKLIDNQTEIIVMLAGDTEDKESHWVLYTPEMVSSLIRNLPSNKKILFLNGPRTGKYKGIHGMMIVDKMAHRTKIDDLTQFVMNNSFNEDWKIVDFKIGKESLWGAALKFCLENPRTIMILPGESTSMISEALGLGIRPSIYKHPAMTEASRKYVDNLVCQGKATLYPQLPQENATHQKAISPQENKIINEICKILGNKKRT